MGHGVAQVAAQAGYNVVALESNSEALDKGDKRIEESLKKMIAKDVKKGKVTDDEGKTNFAEVMSRIVLTTDIAKAHNCDLIIEAIVENMDVKLDFYKHLADKIKSDAIFASNTSSLQVTCAFMYTTSSACGWLCMVPSIYFNHITGMANVSQRPKNFVGLHFFNP
ncbi:hbd, partial [Symbiodinium microadriaticum]